MKRFLNLFRRDRLSRDITRELDFHIAERIDQLIAAGVPRDEAVREARKQFGAYALHKEDTWIADIARGLDMLYTDVRYAIRGLLKSPGFAIVAILTLALGIGANTAMFSVVDHVLIRPLPYADPDRLVMIWEDASSIGYPHSSPSPRHWQANLLLARGRSRQREAAVRSALGAGRARLIAQFLTESVVLAALGAAAGLSLTRPAMAFLEYLVPHSMAMHLTLDWRVMAFCAAISVASGLLFGLAPALGVSRTSAQEALREGGRSIAGSRRTLFQDSLIVAETALAVALLTAGGLLLQTLHHFKSIDLGIRSDKILTTGLPLTRYPTLQRRSAFINDVLERVRAIPGVQSAAFASAIPLTNTGDSERYQFAGQTDQEAQTQEALNRVVTRDYFRTIEAKLREGRFFQENDKASKQPVAIVNESFADRNFPGRSAIGARFRYGNFTADGYWYTIVGVVREIRDRGVSEELMPAIYIVNEQSDQNWATASGLMIRTSVDPKSIISAMREAVWAVDPNEPFVRTRTLDEIVAANLSSPSQDSTLLGAFALLALILASVGLYGVLSYSVNQRANEIGVRMALGATPARILMTFQQRGMRLVATGLAIGLLLSAAGSSLIESLLYGFVPNYVAVGAAASAILLSVAALACFLPARRAARLDPMVVLRSE